MLLKGSSHRKYCRYIVTLLFFCGYIYELCVQLACYRNIGGQENSSTRQTLYFTDPQYFCGRSVTYPIIDLFYQLPSLFSKLPSWFIEIFLRSEKYIQYEKQVRLTNPLLIATGLL